MAGKQLFAVTFSVTVTSAIYTKSSEYKTDYEAARNKIHLG